MVSCAIHVELMGRFGEAYPGYIVDYKAPNSFTFRFVGEESPGFPGEISVLSSWVRKPPKSGLHRLSDSDVDIGDHVEVLAGKTVQNENFNEVFYQEGELPPSWWPARVTKRRGQFVFVEFDVCEEDPELFSNLPKPHFDNVVELNQVRPKNSEHAFKESDFLYHILRVPQELVGLFKEPVNIGHIVRTCGHSMLICQIVPDMKLPEGFSNVTTPEESIARFLVVCTSQETKRKAETIGCDVVRMLKQKHSILHQISELSRRLKEINSTKNDDFICEEFSVEKELVGHSIGTKGANIRRARSVDGIISVILNPDTCTFRVTGRTKEAVDNAKKLLEYTTEAMQVPQQYVARIVGQKNNQIQALVDRVGLARIRVQAADQATVPNCVPFAFTGTRSSINDAKILINFITDNLKEIDQLKSKIIPNEYTPPNCEGVCYKRRDPSSKSEGVRGERNFRLHADGGQFTDTGFTTNTFDGDGGRFRGRRSMNGGPDNSDSTSYRILRKSAYRPRKNQIQSHREGGSTAKLPSPRENSLPPPAPKTAEQTQSDSIPHSGPKQHGSGGRRSKGANRNRVLQAPNPPQMKIEDSSAAIES